MNLVESSSPISDTDIPEVPRWRRGKVRDVYDLGDRLLIVATDRISAFDVVLPTPIPEKGAVLTQLSAFWFDKTRHLVPNHYMDLVLEEPQLEPYRERLGPDLSPKNLIGRSMLVQKAEPVAVECVVRGYISGSGWAEYKQRGTLAGVELPGGLRESSELEDAHFTPATKAESGH